MAQTYHIKVDQGATYKVTLTIQQPGGTPVDLNGFTAYAQMKDVDGADVTAFAVDVVSPKNLGRVNVSLTALQTALLAPGRYFYVFEIESGGVVERVLEGFVLVAAGVTR